MGARGSYNAVTPDDARRLREASGGPDGSERVIDVYHEVCEGIPYTSPWHQALDKSWDNLHRTLTLDNTDEGCLDDDAGDEPWCWCVFGGAQLYFGEDYHLYLIDPDEVAVLAVALADVDELWLRKRFFQLDPKACEYSIDEEEFDYLWSWFRSLPAFFAQAAGAGRSVVFCASL